MTVFVAQSSNQIWNSHMTSQFWHFTAAMCRLGKKKIITKLHRELDTGLVHPQNQVNTIFFHVG